MVGMEDDVKFLLKRGITDHLQSSKEKTMRADEYWKKRCELAEKCIEIPCNPDITLDQIEDRVEWSHFKDHEGFTVEGQNGTTKP